MEDVLNLNIWYDQAPMKVRERIAGIESKLKLSKNPCAVLPLDYAGIWNRWEDELVEAKRRFMEAKHPFHFASLGDAELALLGFGFPWKTNEISNRLRACGFSRLSGGLRQEFRTALKEAALLGLHQRWPPITEITARVLILCGFEIPAPNAVEVHLPYKMFADGSLFCYLAKKRIVLVGDKVRELNRRLHDAGFIEAHSFLGPIGGLNIVGIFETRAKASTVELAPTGGAGLDVDRASEWLKKTDFDIALLGCGAVANILGYRSVQYGKTAIDVGFVFEALLGNSQRDVRPILKEIKWPKWGATVNG